jgi:primase-polymerase (primpol)-like protein
LNYDIIYDYASIPESIREEPIFLLYKTSVREDGTLNKVPYRADGRLASSTDPTTWCMYQEAVEAYNTGKFAGIGIILAPPLCCVDLDHLRNKVTGELHPIAKDIIARVPGWQEISVSETGIHIFGFCDTEFESCSYKWIEDDGEKCAVEIFQEKRFIALTGRLLDGSSDEFDGLTKEITNVYEKYIAPHHQTIHDVKPFVPISNAVIDIDDRLKKAYASKSGPNIRSLMAGDMTDYANDHSAADAGLVAYLAFWLENDYASIEEAFNRSELANRDKWRKRADYRTRTIENAIKITKETYSTWTKKTTMNSTDSNTTFEVHEVPAQSKTTVDKVLEMLTNTRLSKMTIVPVEYFDEPFIMKNAITAFTGEASHGKSTFVLSRLHDVANKHPNAMVIYCDADNPAAIAQERSERLRGPLDDRISYWGGFLTDAEGHLVQPWDIGCLDWIPLIEKIRSTGKDPIIVFDTLNSFMNGQDENNNAVVGKIMNHMRMMTNCGATVLIIHHTGKSPTSKESRGASSFKGGVDAGWLIDSYIIDTEIKTMTVSAWKSRIGKTAKFTYTMTDGRPVTVGDDSNTMLILNFILTHQGKTKDAIEKAAKGKFGRQAVRDAIDLLIVSKHLKVTKNRYYANDVEVPGDGAREEPYIPAAGEPQRKPTMSEALFDNDDEQSAWDFAVKVSNK